MPYRESTVEQTGSASAHTVVVRTTLQENTTITTPRPFVLASVVVLAFASSASLVNAHCDTLNGPVVAAARPALQMGDVTPVVRWVQAADEAEIRRAFEETFVVRKAGPQAQEERT
jgi:hypothetical protein